MFSNACKIVTNCFISINLKILLITILFIMLSPHRAGASEPVPELVILNWSEYMLPEMIAAFEKKHHARVKQVYFESDDDRDQIMLQTEGKGFDLILANGTVLSSYRKRGWFKALPVEKIPNYKHIEERWINAFESAKGYAVPYFWGTLGIAYRKDLISEPITSWTQLYQPAPELQGKILMVKSSRDIIGMALKALHYSANSEDAAELRQAEKLILKLKPYVARFGYISLDQHSSLVTGEIAAATVYGGDALNVAEHNPNIVYVLPTEGGNIWVDYFALSIASKQVDLAASFIDFINQPEWAAKNAEDLYLATPNSAAKKYLSADTLDDPVIYPDASLLNRSEFYKDLSPKSMRRRATIFTRAMK